MIGSRALAPHWRNRLQSALLLAAMAAIWALLGWSLAGPGLMFIVFAAAVMVMLAALPASSRLVLLLYRARPLYPAQAPGLHRLLAELTRRAGLPHTPVLYRVPSGMLNAFTVGHRRDAALALSDGLLHALTWRELAGVLAHELSHLKHNDLWVMALADLVSRMTHLLALTGQLLLLINLPLLLFAEQHLPWLTVLLLLLAPGVNALLQLALSRQREYDADLGAVALTGDPEGLARALVRLEQAQGHWLAQVLLPGRQVPEPSLLRTHPPTTERVRRLMALAATGERGDGIALPGAADGRAGRRPAAHPPPRWRLFGNWY